MSVVLGYACNYYSILLCDKGAVDKNGDITDSNEKLRDIPNTGWVSAIGHAGLAFVAFDEIRSHKIIEFTDILNLYEDLYNKAVEGSVLKNNDGSMLIFTTPDKYYPIANKLYLITLEGSSPELKPIVFENKIIINGDVKWDVIKSKYSYGEIINGSLNDIINIMQAMFRVVSNDSKTISDSFDIGISVLRNGTIKLGKISNQRPTEDSNINWVSLISWI